MKITQVRNATIIVEFDKNKFLIDPWLGPKDYMEGFEAGINSHIRQPRVELPFEIQQIVDVDAVILTHFHPDHFDEYAVNALNKDIKFFVQSQTDLEIIQSYGFKNIEIIKPICESVGMPYDSMGVVFKSENEKTLYIAGDTIWCKEVKDALDKHSPDIIVVNACGATVFNGEHIIMNIDDVKEVLKYSPNSTLIASHMDTVSHLSVTREDLKNFAEKSNISNLLIPNDGDILCL